MKKSIFLLILAVCVFFSGCSNEFAKEDYNNTSKIAQTDNYAAQVSKTTTKNGSVTFSVSKFDGYITIWEQTMTSDTNLPANVSLSLASGTAKLVLVDGNRNVTTLVEHKSEASNDITGKSSPDAVVRLTKGKNMIKLVGYDCEKVEVEITFGEVTAR
ncbi:MAG: hypothetical protein K2J77_02100 [Oscillospiraceae bacterium]|nr:hypothetical protein [Oscillospiraceae bacterium]